MGRSVSTPSNAQVVAYQWHRSYWYCDTCEKEIDDKTCPDDFSGHNTWYDEDNQEWYCDDCGEIVTLEDNGHGDLGHITYYTSDWLDWDEFIYDVRQACQDAWPSLEEVDTWIGREDRVVLENGHAQIGVSEYCGCVAVWIVPYVSDYYPEHANLAYHWIGQIEDKFQKMFGELRLMGHFSNGNAVFQKVERGE